MAMATPHVPGLVAHYLPSTSSDDDDDDDVLLDQPPPLDDDSPDSPDDWSDDRPDSADDYDHSDDSDDSSLAWNTTKISTKHAPHAPHAPSHSPSHSHSHSHSHAHLHHHKRSSFHSACDYLSFFGALRKGFCSRPLDHRFEVYMTTKRADKPSAATDPVPAEKKHKVKSGHKEHDGAASFGTMFKCTVADTPKNLLKRASFSDNSDDQDVSVHQASAEIMAERGLTETHKRTSGIVEAPERDGNGYSSHHATDGPVLADDVSEDENHVESRTIPVSSKTTLGDEKLNIKENDLSSKPSIKAPDQRSSGRESDNKALHGKGDGRHAILDSSNKSSKNQSQVALVNILEPKDKGGVSLESNAIQQSKDSKGKTIPSKDDSNEATETAEIATSSEKKVVQTDADKTKLKDMPLQIYIKEKHPPEVMVKDSKRKIKAKKAKASKGKKLHLFRDGFTLPSATEPVDDAESTPVLDRQSESNNKVQLPTSALKNQILKQVVSTSATEGVKPPTVSKMETGNATELVDGAPLRDGSNPVTLSDTSTAPASVGDPVPSDSGLAAVTLPDSVPEAAVPASAGYQSMEDGVSNLSLTEDRYAAQPEAMSAGSIEEHTMKPLVTAAPPPLPKSSRKWFPPLDPAFPNTFAAADPVTSLNGSLFAPQASVGKALVTNTISYAPTTLLHESEFHRDSFGNSQGNSVPTGSILKPASPNPSSFIEAPVSSYHLGKRIPSPALASSSPRMMDPINAPYSRMMLSVAQSQPFAPSPMLTLSLQQEINPPAFFHVDSRASGNSSWIHPGTHSGPGFPFPRMPTTTSFGQVIGCVNQTLSMYKQMKSFSIEARYLVNVQSIVPGCCKLFLFNIESRQLHGVYVSSSLQALAAGHEFPVAFDCLENYSIPLGVDELDIVLPEARHMDGRPLFLQPNTVEQLVSLFERKNKPRVSWVPSSANGVHGLPGVHGLMEFTAVSTESLSSQDRRTEAMGQGPSFISAGPTSMAMNGMAKDSWSVLSNSPRSRLPESDQAFTSHEPDSSASVQAFPFPPSSISNGDGAKSVWSDSFTRKLPDVKEAAPSPMALWPHLFPKASSPDTVTDNFLHMEAREGNSTQNYHTSVGEIMDTGVRPDSGAEPLTFSQVPESVIRSAPLRPKSAYNPLAVEQGRQRHRFEGSKSSSWSTLLPELDLQQASQYGNSSRSEDDELLASISTIHISEQSNMNSIGGGGGIQSSASASQLPLHYQMDRALPDDLRSDLGLSKIETTLAWSDEPHSTVSSDGATGAANLDQTNICCYCFTRRADHLIIDCQHLGPCLECAASKKIEYCGQLNCHIKVTRLLRLFR